MVATSTALAIPVESSVEHILERVNYLHDINQAQLPDRIRIRSIIDGGPAGIRALLGKRIKLDSSELIPVANLLDSGLRKLAQKLGRKPDLRILPFGNEDSERARKNAELRERILSAYDEGDAREMQLPQIGRWLPGYGFAVWIIRERIDANGFPYPSAELRDPFDVYPGPWGANTQPEDMAIIRTVPHRILARRYPQHSVKILENTQQRRHSSGGVLLHHGSSRSWDNQSGDGLQVAEYYDSAGTWIVIPEKRLVVDFVPNPLQTGARFVLVKRFVFNELIGQYAHIIGLMGMMAKMNILGQIALEDGVFTETNIFGEMETGQYEKGRNATNFLSPGTRVEKPVAQIPVQLFQQIDRVERQLRISGGYPVQDDGANPANTAATGRGLERLDFNPSLEIREYQTAMGNGLVRVDRKLLEWDEILYANQAKPLVGHIKGAPFNTSYTPKAAIAGNFMSRRIYGVMAGWDEPEKIVTGLQLLQGEIIDVETMQENLDGLENISVINERIRLKKAEQAMMDTITNNAINGDPAAKLLLAELIDSGGKNFAQILKKFLTPEEPQISDEEQAFLEAQLQAQQGGQPGAPQGPPPDVTTVLSQLRQGGSVGGGGVQTVGQL